MSEPWYIRFGHWLCEKTGHRWIRHAWIHNGHYHADCALCGRIISTPLKDVK